MGWLGLGVALLLLAVVVALKAREMWSEAGLPAGRLIYSDTGTWFRQEEPLYAPHIRLTGRPDYLVEERDGSIIPVEVKSSPAPQVVHDGHLLQLAAYCLLVEVSFGTRPGYGILQYQDKAFAIDYTPELEEDLLDLLADMHQDRRAANVDRDHENPRRCAHCGHRAHCDQRL